MAVVHAAACQENCALPCAVVWRFAVKRSCCFLCAGWHGYLKCHDGSGLLSFPMAGALQFVASPRLWHLHDHAAGDELHLCINIFLGGLL